MLHCSSTVSPPHICQHDWGCFQLPPLESPLKLYYTNLNIKLEWHSVERIPQSRPIRPLYPLQIVLIYKYQPSKYTRFCFVFLSSRSFRNQQKRQQQKKKKKKSHSIKESEKNPRFVLLSGSAPKVNGVCSGLRLILHPSLVEMTLFVFGINSIWALFQLYQPCLLTFWCFISFLSGIKATRGG